MLVCPISSPKITRMLGLRSPWVGCCCAFAVSTGAKTPNAETVASEVLARSRRRRSKSNPCGLSVFWRPVLFDGVCVLIRYSSHSLLGAPAADFVIGDRRKVSVETRMHGYVEQRACGDNAFAFFGLIAPG